MLLILLVLYDYEKRARKNLRCALPATGPTRWDCLLSGLSVYLRRAYTRDQMKHSHPQNRLILTALTLATSAALCLGAETSGTNAFSISTGPVLQCPTDTSMRVTWITARNATGAVEYGLADGELKRASSSRHGLIDANQRVHSVLLEGLQPGALYRYRVVSREITTFSAYKVVFGDTVTSEFQEFRALDKGKDEFSFLVFNDLHDDASTIPELLKIAGPKPYDFVVLNGDVVSHTEDQSQVTSILNQAASSFAATIPMFWVRGNHETRGSFARQLPAYIGLPDSRYYYSFTHGSVHFIVLDAGEDKIDAHREYSGLVDFTQYRREQAEWLKAEVRTEAFQRAKYRVVICHMPFASKRAADPEHHSEKNVFLGMAEAYEQFGQLLESAGTDLMLSGHTHFAALIKPEEARHSYPIVQGGGNKGQSRTIIRVDVNNTGLEAVILRPDGSRVASCRVEPRSL